jgi:hypothetical protein
MRAGAGTSAPYRRQVSGQPEAREVSSIGRCPAPLAIPAIINASKVNTLLQHGDYAGAQAAAAESKKWSKLAPVIGLIGWVIGVVCCVVYFVVIASTAASESF